jgi:hypothetical protein
LITLQPVPVTITANCTLRILQTTYWDDTLITYQNLLLNQLDSAAWSTSGATGDGGVAQAVTNVLYKVCGWNPSAIHIQSIPTNFINYAAQVYVNQIAGSELSQDSLQQLSQILSVQGISSGRSVSTGTFTTGQNGSQSNSNAPTGIETSATAVTPFITSPIAGGKANFPGPNVLNPVSINAINEDIFYCSAPWAYLKYQITPNLTASGKKNYQTIQDNAKTWLANNWSTNVPDGRLLVFYNNQTDRAVAVRATSIPQKTNVSSKGYAVYDPTVTTFQCHPSVVAYLNGTVSDPNSWTSSINPGTANVTVNWADMSKVSKAGILPNPSSNLLKSGTDGATNIGNTNDPLTVVGVLDTLVQNLLGQVGDTYTENTSPSAGLTRINPGKPGTGTGSFDCSGLAYWGYSTIGIQLHGSDTWTECGPTDGSQPETYGAWTPNTTMPKRGDLIFWEVSGDGGSPPQHVSILISDFGATGPQGQSPNPDIAYLIESSHGGYNSANQNPPINSYIYLHDNNAGPNVQAISWKDVKNGQWQSWGGRIIGFRSPITLHPTWTSTQLQQLQITQSSLDNIQAQGTGAGTNPSTGTVAPSNPNNPTNPTNAGSSSTTTIASGTATAATLLNAYSNLLQPPQFDVRASMLVSTPRAFLLDNPVMNDITQIMGAGLRSYQSAPNGDFVAWFPDYYGIYGTDPVIEISPVEIIDLQIYHDDNQLTTHVGVVGDTTGVGSQVSAADYLTTNGIVSIQDGSTMQMLFGTQNPNPKNNTQNSTESLNFLNKYGMRPYVQEQQMLHNYSLEYVYALYTFMNQWANQFASQVTFTFMPELYPGMRIVINMPNGTASPDRYEFYTMSVTHTGDRAGGFTTQVTLSSPKINGNIIHYGLNLS